MTILDPSTKIGNNTRNMLAIMAGKPIISQEQYQERNNQALFQQEQEQRNQDMHNMRIIQFQQNQEDRKLNKIQTQQQNEWIKQNRIDQKTQQQFIQDSQKLSIQNTTNSLAENRAIELALSNIPGFKDLEKKEQNQIMKSKPALYATNLIAMQAYISNYQTNPQNTSLVDHYAAQLNGKIKKEGNNIYFISNNKKEDGTEKQTILFENGKPTANPVKILESLSEEVSKQTAIYNSHNKLNQNNDFFTKATATLASSLPEEMTTKDKEGNTIELTTADKIQYINQIYSQANTKQKNFFNLNGAIQILNAQTASQQQRTNAIQQAAELMQFMGYEPLNTQNSITPDGKINWDSLSVKDLTQNGKILTGQDFINHIQNNDNISSSINNNAKTYKIMQESQINQQTIQNNNHTIYDTKEHKINEKKLIAEYESKFENDKEKRDLLSHTIQIGKKFIQNNNIFTKQELNNITRDAKARVRRYNVESKNKINIDTIPNLIEATLGNILIRNKEDINKIKKQTLHSNPEINRISQESEINKLIWTMANKQLKKELDIDEDIIRTRYQHYNKQEEITKKILKNNKINKYNNETLLKKEVFDTIKNIPPKEYYNSPNYKAIPIL